MAKPAEFSVATRRESLSKNNLCQKPKVSKNSDKANFTRS